MKNIRIPFPVMIFIEICATWIIGQFNVNLGIVVGCISMVHILTVSIIGQILKKKQKENERLN